MRRIRIAAVLALCAPSIVALATPVAADSAAVAPQRVLDTRAGIGTTAHALAPGETLALAVAAAKQAGATSVALNLTVTDAGGAGFLTAWPCGQPMPATSVLNFVPGQTVANFVAVGLGAAGVCLAASAPVQVVVDSFGWGGHGNGLTLESPSRLLDTRNGTGSTSGAASPANTITLRVAGRGGVPNDATAALVAITATGGTADGFLTAWPCDQPRPVASVLNLRPGLLRSNAALLHLSQADGSVCLYAWTVNGSAVHLVVDAVGWIPGSVSRQPPPPEPSPPPPSGGSGHFGTLPPGSALPDDAQCAARVRPAAEVRQANIPYNQTKGHGAPSNPPAALYARVTGNFTGTTDEILQWAACKWGIDEDIVRAQAAKESWWDQRNIGDNGESFGILQDRKPYMEWAFNNGVGDAQSSTADNVDVSLAARRNCFEGNETWLNTVDRGRDYAAGDLWGCVGMWFSGRWYTQPAVDYIAAVQDWLNQRIWETPDFLGYG